MNRFLYAFIAFALAGCQLDSPLPAPGADNANWHQAGFEDALSGAAKKDDATLAANFNAVKPNHTAYLKGYASGQQKICRADVLFGWGQNGKIFPASCDELNNAKQLRDTWQKGMDKGARDALSKE